MDKNKPKRFIFIIAFLLALAITAKQYRTIQNSQTEKKAPVSQPLVKTENRKLLTDFDNNGEYKEFFIKGVIYNPTPIGRFPSDTGWKEFHGRLDNMFDDDDVLHRDFSLLQSMNCNTIRIWSGNDLHTRKGKFPNRITQKTLDIAESYDIKVIAGFKIDSTAPKCSNNSITYTTPDFTDEKTRNKIIKKFSEYVSEFKDHPAILFWAIGNGNNNHIDPDNIEQIKAWYSLANDMAKAAHDIEGTKQHPVALVNSEIYNIDNSIYMTTDHASSAIDIWGINIFRGNTFGNLFKNYETLSKKPLWISEYGIDAWISPDYNQHLYGKEDHKLQAEWIGSLWDEIKNNKDITIGGTVKEFSDEWWKPSAKLEKGTLNDSHDLFGIAPEDRNCDGILDWFPSAPDKFFHSEWWGIIKMKKDGTSIDIANPRQAYYTLQEKFKE